MTTSQYSTGKHLGHIILSHPIWMQFFQGHKFIRETDCKQIYTHTQEKNTQTDPACSPCIYMTTWPRNSRYHHGVTGSESFTYINNSRNLASLPQHRWSQHFRGDCGSLQFVVYLVIPKKPSCQSYSELIFHLTESPSGFLVTSLNGWWKANSTEDISIRLLWIISEGINQSTINKNCTEYTNHRYWLAVFILRVRPPSVNPL